MRPSTVILLLYFSQVSPLVQYPILPTDNGLTPPEMIRNHGYPCEIHHFKTFDGFILEYHRVPHGFKDRNIKKRRTPVLLMHGLTFTSVQDFAQGPKKALGYLLADNGYDVWAANIRGNHFSRNHTRLDWKRNMREYFDFTFHEIGHIDIPTAIDYILNVTGFEKLIYCGNSLGGSVFLTFGSTQPKYVKKIQLAVLMSPAGYMKHENAFGDLTTYYIDSLQEFFKRQQLWAIDVSFFRKAWKYVISSPMYVKVMENVFKEVLVSDEDAEALVPYFGAYLANFPSEFPYKHIVHYGQLIKNGGFRQFDYGLKKNLKKYGTRIPPDYNVSAITCPVAIYYSKADFLVPYKQQLLLKSKLPNIVFEYTELTGRYNHMSFGAAKDCAQRIWGSVIKVVEKYKLA